MTGGDGPEWAAPWGEEGSKEEETISALSVWVQSVPRAESDLSLSSRDTAEKYFYFPWQNLLTRFRDLWSKNSCRPGRWSPAKKLILIWRSFFGGFEEDGSQSFLETGMSLFLWKITPDLYLLGLHGRPQGHSTACPWGIPSMILAHLNLACSLARWEWWAVPQFLFSVLGLAVLRFPW